MPGSSNICRVLLAEPDAVLGARGRGPDQTHASNDEHDSGDSGTNDRFQRGWPFGSRQTDVNGDQVLSAAGPNPVLRHRTVGTF